MATRVFLADDHAVLREGLAALLAAEADLEVVGQAGTAEDTVSGCIRTNPDIALIDLTMPGGGLHAIELLHERCPDLRSVVLTMHDDPAYMRAALEAGAVGYLVKDAAADELTAAVRLVASGRSYIKVSVQPQSSSLGLGGPDPTKKLSPREREVLVLLARGHTNREIAEQLGLKKKTIDTYRTRLQDKLGLSSRAELVSFALKMGLLGPGDA